MGFWRSVPPYDATVEWLENPNMVHFVVKLSRKGGNVHALLSGILEDWTCYEELKLFVLSEVK